MHTKATLLCGRVDQAAKRLGTRIGVVVTDGVVGLRRAWHILRQLRCLQAARVDDPVCGQRHLLRMHCELRTAIDRTHRILKSDEAAVGLKDALQTEHEGMGIDDTGRGR